MGQGFIKQNGVPKGGYKQLVNYTMLYDYGDECTDITGGWKITGHEQSGSQQSSGGTLTKNSTHLSLYIKKGASNWWRTYASPSKAFTIGDHAKLWVIIACTCGTYSIGGLYITTSKVTSQSTLDAQSDKYGRIITWDVNMEKSLHSIDLSAVKSASPSMYPTLSAKSVGYATTVNLYACFAVKSDNWSELATIAGVSASSISTLLTKSSTILKNKDAVEFMIYQCTGYFMVSALQNSKFLTALASSPYKEAVYANEHWARFLAMVA
jgi:hypothetical protein